MKWVVLLVHRKFGMIEFAATWEGQECGKKPLNQLGNV
jgi:hypothetical protein